MRPPFLNVCALTCCAPGGSRAVQSTPSSTAERLAPPRPAPAGGGARGVARAAAAHRQEHRRVVPWPLGRCLARRSVGRLASARAALIGRRFGLGCFAPLGRARSLACVRRRAGRVPRRGREPPDAPLGGAVGDAAAARGGAGGRRRRRVACTRSPPGSPARRVARSVAPVRRRRRRSVDRCMGRAGPSCLADR